MTKKENSPALPQARERGLVVRELPDEVLVYDLERHKAHCLNDFASKVWRHCDGRTPVAKMAVLLAAECDRQVSQDEIWFALKRLGKAHLLTDPVAIPERMARLSRREVVRRSGFAAGLAIITSIAVPPAAMAASCPGGFTDCRRICSEPGQVGKCCLSPPFPAGSICTQGTVDCGNLQVTGQIGKCVV